MSAEWLKGIDRQMHSGLVLACNGVWRSYLTAGPGRVHTEAAARFEAAASRALESESGAMLPSELQRLFDLLQRCIDRPEGLCFVSGEAGLIPRQDLHAAVESGLQLLASARPGFNLE